MESVNIRKNDRICKVKLDDDYTYLGNIGNLMLYAYMDDATEILVRLLVESDTRSHTCVGLVDLLQDFDDVYSVGMVRIAKEYQGFNIAPRMYRMVMKKLGIAISTQNCQSPGGQSIWSRMFSRKDIQITAYRRGKRRPSKTYPVYFDETEGRLDGEQYTIWDGSNWELIACLR